MGAKRKLTARRIDKKDRKDVYIYSLVIGRNRREEQWFATGRKELEKAVFVNQLSCEVDRAYSISYTGTTAGACSSASVRLDFLHVQNSPRITRERTTILAFQDRAGLFRNRTSECPSEENRKLGRGAKLSVS